MPKNLFLLVTEDAFTILNKDNEVQWNPHKEDKAPYALPIVHFLYSKFNLSDGFKEFKTFCKKKIFKMRFYIIIPDDYTFIERRALEDFIYRSNVSSSIYVLPYSLSIFIVKNIINYISITATKRCISLNKIVGGKILDTQYVSWLDSMEQIEKMLAQWEQLPVYICDPNELLNGYEQFCKEKVYIKYSTIENLIYFENVLK